MTVLHQNIRGLSNKINRLNHLLNESSPSILVLTEHGLQQNEIINTKLDGYTLISEYCRTQHRLGGVAIYCKDTLSNSTEAIEIKNFCEELLLEAAMTRVTLKGNLVYILGVYRPPGGNVRTSLENLSQIMDHTQAHNKMFILMGDINIDSLKNNNPDTILLNEELTIQNMRRLPLTATRVTAESRTSIDCICTSFSIENTTTSILQTGLSDHTAQLCSIDITHKKNIVTSLKRKLSNQNLENLKSLLSIKHWDTVINARDSETAYSNFNDILRIALDITCPKRKTRNRGGNKPVHYYDPESIEMKALYLRALTQFDTTGDARDKEIMINRKKLYDQKLKTLRQQANLQYIQDSDNKTKALWNVINSERLGKKTDQACPKLNIGDTIIDSPMEVAENFNAYFSQVADITIEQNNLLPVDTGEENYNHLNIPPTQSFQLTPTTWTEVQRVIKNLKNKSSSGLDEFSSKIVKYCAHELVHPLTSIINKSFSDGHFPSKLKISKIYAKHKKGPKSELQNYRPISLISTFSKIIEKLVLKRLMDYLNHYNLISDSQHGFQKGKSTISAIISLTESLIDGIDEEKYITALFLDYSKAFDCLGHDLISKKLTNLGITGKENMWFMSYLQGRSQVVEVQDTKSGITSSYISSQKPISRGVPQGSVLGPILFILLTNDFPAFITNHSTYCVMYADDTTLLIKNDSAEELYSNSRTSLKRAIKYSKLNDLAINTNKTTQVHFSRKKTMPTDIPDIPVLNHVNFLGMILDNRLSWTEHLNTISNKICTGIYVMKRIKSSGTQSAAKAAYYAFVESHIRYGLIIWGSYSGNLQRTLILQKRAIRSLANLEHNQSCREAFVTLGILTVPALYLYETILHADRLKLQTLEDVHNHHTRHASRYVLPHHRTALFEKKPSYAGRKFKNLLPENLQGLTGKTLQTPLKDFFIKKPIYSIEEFMAAV